MSFQPLMFLYPSNEKKNLQEKIFSLSTIPMIIHSLSIQERGKCRKNFQFPELSSKKQIKHEFPFLVKLKYISNDQSID